MLSQFIGWGNEHTLYGPWGRFLEVCMWFPLDFPHVSFPCADFALHPFVAMNHSHEYNYVFSPMSLLSESSHLGLILKTRVHHRRELTLRHRDSLWPRAIHREEPALSHLKLLSPGAWSMSWSDSKRGFR